MSRQPLSQIVLRANMGELATLNRWIGSLSERHELPAQLAFRIDLCLTEVVTNVISYAYVAQQYPVDPITVLFNHRGSTFTFEVLDHGAPFDPTAYVPAPIPTSLEDAQIGGRGLRLVRQFTSALRYRRDDDVNHLELVFAPSP